MKSIERVWKEQMIEIIMETKKENPYPSLIFVSLKGKAAHHSWNMCCETILEKLEEKEQ